MPDYHNISILDPPASPYSHIAEADGLVCLAGQVAADSPGGRAALGDVGRETASVMEQIGVSLRARGLSFADVLRVDIHLVDLDDVKTVDPIYARYFAAGRRPARTCVEVRRLCGGSRIEITVMACREPERRAIPDEGQARRGAGA